MRKKNKKDLEQVVDAEMRKRRKPANYTYYKAEKLYDNKAILVPFSDWHYGNKYCKVKELEKNLQWAYENDNVYLLLNGDLIESKTRSKRDDGVFTQLNPQNQINYVIEHLEPFAEQGRLVAMTNGNHEDSITKETGIDVTAMLADKFGIPYLKNGGFVAFKVGKNLYNFYVTHGSSGATLPYTKIKAALNLGSFVDGVDAIIYGHVHDKQDHTQEIYYPDNRAKCVKTKKMHYILSGHYLDYLNSYAQMKSMRPSATGTPKIKMKGDERQLRVSL